MQHAQAPEQQLTSTPLGEGCDPRHDDTLAWLRSEFPAWSFEVDTAASWNGAGSNLWIAKRDGDHPQAEKSAGRLHTRLEEYLHRISRRGPQNN